MTLPVLEGTVGTPAGRQDGPELEQPDLPPMLRYLRGSAKNLATEIGASKGFGRKKKRKTETVWDARHE